MERLKRYERMAAMARMLSERPSEVITLSHFCDLFDAAKSSVSEDVEMLRTLFEKMDLGQIYTVTGAAGGVVYTPFYSEQRTLKYIEQLARLLREPARVLPSDFLYLTDLLTSPIWAERIGCMLAARFAALKPDFVLTVETGGIPLALMTARALNTPVVVVRRDHSAEEGSMVTISYKSGSSGRISTMSLPRRAIRAGQKALIVDDFIKAGGTARGLMDLMREFSVDVVGMGFLIMTREPEHKRVEGAQALMIMEGLGEEGAGAKITASSFREGG